MEQSVMLFGAVFMGFEDLLHQSLGDTGHRDSPWSGLHGGTPCPSTQSRSRPGVRIGKDSRLLLDLLSGETLARCSEGILLGDNRLAATGDFDLAFAKLKSHRRSPNCCPRAIALWFVQ